LLHLLFTKEDLNSAKELQLRNDIKYSQRLDETLRQMEKRLKHLSDYESLDLTSGIVPTKRLPVFEQFAKSDEETVEVIPSTISTAPAKKTSLKLRSREFHMPSKKASGLSCQPSIGEQGNSTAQTFIRQVSDSGKAQ